MTSIGLLAGAASASVALIAALELGSPTLIGNRLDPGSAERRPRHARRRDRRQSRKAYDRSVTPGTLIRAAVALAWLGPCAAQTLVGSIDFFASQGVDIEALRGHLSARSGDTWTSESKERLTSDILRLLGRTPSDVASVCCDGGGKLVVYIGLADRPGPRVRLRTPSAELSELPEGILVLYQQLDAAWERAAATGGDAVREDRTRGYRACQK